jgi:hypothetical protein
MAEWKTCQTCDGKGAFYGETCDTCGGVGKVNVSSGRAPSSAPTAGSIDTPEFRRLTDEIYGAGQWGDSDEKEVAALIAHIDAWGGAAPAPGNTAQPTKAYITERAAEFIRAGCSTSALMSAVATESETVAVHVGPAQAKE